MNTPRTVERKTVWETLSRIDVSGHTEKKGNLTYLSWAWAWGKLKDHYPEASFTKHVNATTGLPFWKDPDTENAYVQVSVSAGGELVTETFPVLDHSNKPIQHPTAFDVNTSLQRCMAKAIAYLGLGHYIYAGEDLPPMPRVAQVQTTEADKVEAIGAAMIAEVFEKFIPLQNSNQALEEFWQRNTQALGILKTENSTEYERIIALFKQRKAKIAAETA